MKEFTSELEAYPGSFSLPEPFLDRHMRIWWNHAIKPLQGVSTLDYEFYDGEWKGAVALIQQFGAWNIDGVPVGDLETDAIPSAVKGWVMQEASDFIYPFLPPKLRLKALGIT